LVRAEIDTILKCHSAEDANVLEIGFDPHTRSYRVLVESPALYEVQIFNELGTLELYYKSPPSNNP
jgi:hypothetical protein